MHLIETIFVKCIFVFRYACLGYLLETLRIYFCLDTQRLSLWIKIIVLASAANTLCETLWIPAWYPMVMRLLRKRIFVSIEKTKVHEGQCPHTPERFPYCPITTPNGYICPALAKPSVCVCPDYFALPLENGYMDT